MLIPSRSLSEPLSGSAQFLREIHRHLGPASSETLLAFQAVFDLPDSRTGLLSICSELCADIHARDKPVRSPEVQAWHEAIDQLRRDIRTITGITDEHDRSTATTLKLPLASLLLTFPAISLRPQQERSLRCLRADLCLWHLSTKQRLHDPIQPLSFDWSMSATPSKRTATFVFSGRRRQSAGMIC